MPVDLGDSTSNGVGVLKDHDGLSGNVLTQQLRLLTAEVLLKQVDLVVLSNGFLGTRC